MRLKTQGIALQYMRYRENSIIAKIFTREYGFQSYLVTSLNNRKSTFKIAFFQPLTLLELEVLHKDNRGLQRILEIKTSEPIIYSSSENSKKISISFFIVELLSKTLTLDEKQCELFDFMVKTIAQLKELEVGYRNFPISFIINWGKYMGFELVSIEEVDEQLRGNYQLSLSKQESEFLKRFFDKKKIMENCQSVCRGLMNKLLHFYMIHIPTLRRMKSIDVLKSLEY